MMEPSLLQFYISRQWLNKFKTFAEPGPISNDDFLCSHGGACDYVVVILKSLGGHPFFLSLRKRVALCRLLTRLLLSSLPWIFVFDKAEYSLHNTADFKGGFYVSLCR